MDAAVYCFSRWDLTPSESFRVEEVVPWWKLSCESFRLLLVVVETIVYYILRSS